LFKAKEKSLNAGLGFNFYINRMGGYNFSGGQERAAVPSNFTVN